MFVHVEKLPVLIALALCDYYSSIPILSPFLFTLSLYVAILNLQDFSFTCLLSFLMPLAFAYVVAMVMVVVVSTCMCKLTWLCVLL